MKHLSVLNGGLFMLGFMMATGVDRNPIQALYAVVLIIAARLCVMLQEKRLQSRERKKKSMNVNKKMEDAA